MSERVVSKMKMEQNRWLYELYWECTDVLTVEERDIYFAHELHLINEQIEKEMVELYKSVNESLGLIRHSERLLDLACQRAVLKDCVEDTTLKNKYSLIPKRKLVAMRELESSLSRESQKIS